MIADATLSLFMNSNWAPTFLTPPLQKFAGLPTLCS